MQKGCYLISPIDFVGENSASYHQKRAELVAALSRSGFTVYQPHLSFQSGPLDRDGAKYIESTNRAALMKANVAVAFLPHGTPTLGCGVEFEVCRVAGIPLIILTDRETNSVTMKAMADHITITVSDAVFAASDTVYNKRFEMESRVPKSGLNDLKVLVSEEVEDPKPGISYGIDTPKLPGDVGYDLHAIETVTIPAKGQADIRTSVYMDMCGLWAMILPRSSSSRNRLYISPGVIDCGYQGEMLINVINLNDYEVTINEGDRPAQAVFLHPVHPAKILATREQFANTTRGDKGWGSTNNEQFKLGLEIEGHR